MARSDPGVGPKSDLRRARTSAAKRSQARRCRASCTGASRDFYLGQARFKRRSADTGAVTLIQRWLGSY